MKKISIFTLIFVAFFCVTNAYAEENSSMTFDNVTFGKVYKIKGYASIKLLGFKFVNMYAQWEDSKAGANLEKKWVNIDKDIRNRVLSSNKKGQDSVDEYYAAFQNCIFKYSGNEAEFAWLKVDVINFQKAPANFVKDITIKVIFNDEYEYDGWVRQFNYNYSKSEIYRHQDTTVIGWPVCLSPVDEMQIDPIYEGHYAFGCTLPNYVVENAAPLRMIINMGGHKLTYNIR